ncbi:hemagglutinin repeat-containing protein [Oryzomicrobium sp.]|uniref:hemagglutinin repeat-containing protein n=1 Tax=Oryzomicrobium sp. TaxID=1911578 RepID=UPI0025EE4D2D|nr:hemagglutinin repeat-containing protein [Oryzomicrobium sp.]MCE1244340.1 hemagglutinin repeat-containing protein [Oryzomicrobium sp.]
MSFVKCWIKIKSGNDTTLKGAQLAANHVTLDVGRNLTIETLQDRSQYESEQTSGGFGVSLCIPPFCYGTSSASVNASDQSIKHNYQSAVGQSGIEAGDGGCDIKVGL